MATTLKKPIEKQTRPDNGRQPKEDVPRQLTPRDSARLLAALESNEPPNEALQKAAQRFKERYS